MSFANERVLGFQEREDRKCKLEIEEAPEQIPGKPPRETWLRVLAETNCRILRKRTISER